MDLYGKLGNFANSGIAHVLLAQAGDLAAADARLRPVLDKDGTIAQTVSGLPDEWFGDEDEFDDLDS